MSACTPATLEVRWSLTRRTEHQCFAELAKLGGLAEHPIDVGRNVPFRHQALTPTGQKNHGNGVGGALHEAGNLTTVHAGHTQIGNHNGEGFTSSLRGTERINPRLASVRGNHLMAIALQSLAECPNDQRVVIHDQNTQPRWIGLRRLGRTKVARDSDRNGKTESHGRTLARRAFDFEIRAVPL